MPNLLSLLASRDPRLDGIASQFRERSKPLDMGTLAWLAALLAAIVIVFWLSAHLVERRERHTTCHRPWRLLWSLSRAHRLRWPEILFLWRLARYQGLEDPARLFLEPERLAPQQAGLLLGARTGLLESLRGRIFAGIDEPEGLPGCSQPSERIAPEGGAAIKPPTPFIPVPSWPITSATAPLSE